MYVHFPNTMYAELPLTSAERVNRNGRISSVGGWDAVVQKYDAAFMRSTRES